MECFRQQFIDLKMKYIQIHFYTDIDTLIIFFTFLRSEAL